MQNGHNISKQELTKIAATQNTIQATRNVSNRVATSTGCINSWLEAGN